MTSFASSGKPKRTIDAIQVERRCRHYVPDKYSAEITEVSWDQFDGTPPPRRLMICPAGPAAWASSKR